MNRKSILSFIFLTILLLSSIGLVNASEIIVDGYVGSLEVTALNQTPSDTLNLGQELNGSDVTSLTATITDDAVKSNPYDINTSGLVGWWKFDDDYLDSSGNGNNGTAYGSDIHFVNGKYNNASQFNGVSDFVDCGNDESLDITEEITLSSWINIKKVQSEAWSNLFGRWETSLDLRCYSFAYQADVKRIYFFISNNGDTYSYVSFTLNSFDQWVHMVGTFDGTNIKIYEDGILKDTITYITTINSEPTKEVTIGGRKDAVDRCVDGSLADVRIYNRALDPAEIQNNYYDKLQQLQVNTTANTSLSTEWNSTANNPLSVPYFDLELFSGLKFTVPETVVQDGITIYDYPSTVRFDVIANVEVKDDITKISEVAANGLYSLNITHTPTNSGSGYINYTTTNALLLNADFTNPATLTSNNQNATLSGSFNISTGYITAETEYYYIVNQYYFYPPTNLQTTYTTSSINVSWDATPNADQYSIYQKDECVVYTSDTITIDGIGNEPAWDTAYKFIIDTPNPVVYTDYDIMRGLYDVDYFYILVEAKDNDANTLDDSSYVYGDFLNDGLTNDDRMWEVKENGDITRYKWSGSAWIPSPGTNAIASVTGAGTYNIVAEFAIPITEMGANFTNGSIFPILWERTCSALNPDVHSYNPFENINNTDVSLWAQVQICNESESKTFIANTTDLYYNVTGLDFFTWYEIRVSAWNGSQETSSTKADEITLDVPRWIISGYVLDGDGEPIEGAQVWAQDGFISARNTSNADGYYQSFFRDDNYTFYANKTGYIQNNVDVTVFGANQTNVNITLQMVTNADIFVLLTEVQAQNENATTFIIADLATIKSNLSLLQLMCVLNFILIIAVWRRKEQ